MKRDIDQIIDEVLKIEPDFKLRKDFSDGVIKRLRKIEAASQRKLYFLIALGTLFIFGSGIALLAFFLPESWVESFRLQGVDQIVPMAVVIGLVVGLIQYLDKVLVKDRMLRMH